MASAFGCNESIAPGYFPLSSSDEDLIEKTEVALERCPLCLNSSQRIFYCQQCIRSGNFAQSESTERYLEKKLKLYKAQTLSEELATEIEAVIEEKKKREALRQQIKVLRERNRLLLQQEQSLQSSIKQGVIQLRELQQSKNEARKLLARLKRKVSRVAEHIELQRAQNQTVASQLGISRAQLSGVIRGSAKQLLQYIFPVEKIISYDSDEEEGSIDTVNALADATQTAYIRGRWVYANADVQVQYRIVEALLPGAGDVASFRLCVIEDEKMGHRKGSQSFVVALSYTAQVVQVLAFYLGLKLPRRVSFLDFSGNMNENELASRITALQRNVLFLCASQRIPADRLRNQNPLARIQALLDTDTCDLGRNGSFEFHSELWSLDEPPEADDNECTVPDESNSDEDNDSVNADWEPIAHPTQQEMASVQSSQRTITNEAPVSSSVVGGVVSSVTSLWKAWPWGK